MFETIRQGFNADGDSFPIAKLCYWLPPHRVLKIGEDCAQDQSEVCQTDQNHD